MSIFPHNIQIMSRRVLAHRYLDEMYDKNTLTFCVFDPLHTDNYLYGIRNLNAEYDKYLSFWAENHSSRFNQFVFDDLTYKSEETDILPTKQDVAKVIKTVFENKKAILDGTLSVNFACRAGISRSSSLAYVAMNSLTDISTKMSLSILDPVIHYPNKLIVKFGSELLDSDRVYEAYKNIW